MQITGCCCLLFFVFGDLWSNCGWLRPSIQFCVWSYMNELKNAPFLPLLWIKVCKICGEGSYRCVIQCGCKIGWKLSERENFTFYQCKWRFTDSKGSRRLKNLSTKRICVLLWNLTFCTTFYSRKVFFPAIPARAWLRWLLNENKVIQKSNHFDTVAENERFILDHYLTWPWCILVVGSNHDFFLSKLWSVWILYIIGKNLVQFSVIAILSPIRE